jgi:hypothetical protein
MTEEDAEPLRTKARVTTRRFPPPWIVAETDGSTQIGNLFFVVATITPKSVSRQKHKES